MLFQLLTGIPCVAQRMFNNPRTNVLGFNTQDPVFIMQVHIPAYNTLEAIQVCTHLQNMLPVAQIGFKNEDVHI